MFRAKSKGEEYNLNFKTLKPVAVDQSKWKRLQDLDDTDEPVLHGEFNFMNLHTVGQSGIFLK